MSDKPSEGTPLPDPPADAIHEVVPTEHIAPEVVPGELQTPTPETPESQPDKAAPDATSPTKTALVAPKNAVRLERKRPPQKPQKRPQRYRFVTVASAIRSLSVTFAAAVIVATIFMWWTSPDFLPLTTRQNLAPVEATARQIFATRTALPTPGWFNRIGIVAGHSGIATRGSTAGRVDPGAVCPDGFTEGSVTKKVAVQVAAILRGRGYTVDILDEYDMRLFSYQAAAFISVHAQPCEDYGYGGFAITSSAGRTSAREQDLQLSDCVRQNYSQVTGLEFQAGNITEDMTDYHAFREIAPTTPGVVLELGYIGHDRDMLQNHTDKLALGVVNGLRCYIEPVALSTDVASQTASTAAPTSRIVLTPTIKPTVKP